MASLIYEGVMHRYPGPQGGHRARRRLLPALPRAHGPQSRQPSRHGPKNTGGKKPSEFLRSFHYDTCVYDPQVLKVLVERIGADRLVMGSDYPVGEKDPVGFVERLRECRRPSWQ